MSTRGLRQVEKRLRSRERCSFWPPLAFTPIVGTYALLVISIVVVALQEGGLPAQVIFSGVLLGAAVLFTTRYTARELGRDTLPRRSLKDVYRRARAVGSAGLLNAADAAANLAAADLRRSVDRFLLLSRLAFLFGTLGTVTGIIHGYNRPTWPPCFADDAYALSQALVTLGSGVAACVVLRTVHHFLKMRTEERIAEVRVVARALLDLAADRLAAARAG
jgi:uncharacterized membrane protein YdcZ (DUF606 family)